VPPLPCHTACRPSPLPRLARRPPMRLSFGFKRDLSIPLSTLFQKPFDKCANILTSACAASCAISVCLPGADDNPLPKASQGPPPQNGLCPPAAGVVGQILCKIVKSYPWNLRNEGLRLIARTEGIVLDRSNAEQGLRVEGSSSQKGNLRCPKGLLKTKGSFS
jgi:hypothetical protein